MADTKNQVSAWGMAKPYVNGGLSGMMSTAIIQPIDMVKVRLQLGDTGGPVRACITIALPTQHFLFFFFFLGGGVHHVPDHDDSLLLFLWYTNCHELYAHAVGSGDKYDQDSRCRLFV